MRKYLRKKNCIEIEFCPKSFVIFIIFAIFAPLNQNDSIMRKTALCVLMMIGAGILLPSCEKTATDSFPIMESFYTESKGLQTVSKDSVNRFSDKVNGYVVTNPQAKNHSKYKLIMDNIKDATLRLTIEVDDEWAGDTTITF